MAQTTEKELAEEVKTLETTAKEYLVITSNNYLDAGTFLKDLKKHKEKIVAYFKPLKEAAHKAHKEITQREARELKPVVDIELIIRKSINSYLDEQERIRLEVQRKAEAEAEEKARKEREKLLAQAAKAEQKGKEEKAEALKEKAENVYVEPVFAEPELPKTLKTEAGTFTTKKDISVTITDQKLAIESVAKGLLPIGCIEFKTQQLKTYCKMQQIKGNQIPGIFVKETSNINIR